jgi:hypothetical protein
MGNADCWFGLKRSTKEALEQHGDAYCSFGLSSPQRVVVLPYAFLAQYLDGCFTSPDKEGGILHWHVRFNQDGEEVYLLIHRDQQKILVSEYLLRD